MEGRYYSFNRYLREKYGERVHRLSVNAGFSCPNMDGTFSSSGCVFCNNKSFSHFAKYQGSSLQTQIQQSMEYAQIRFKAKKFIVYFQSYSGTYGTLDFFEQQCECIRNFKNIVGLTISTRPDCIDEAKLDLLQRMSGEYDVLLEYGLQSVHEKSLRTLNRNHSFLDFKNAVAATVKRRSIKVGVHVILGIPGESQEDMIKTAQTIALLPLWGIKFHCFHVVKGTFLAQRQVYNTLPVVAESEYVNYVVEFLRYIPQHWVILRLVSDADRELLISPQWINEKQRVIDNIKKTLASRQVRQGDLYKQSICADSEKNILRRHF